MESKLNARIREKFDFGWMFHRGDLAVPFNKNVGMAGGPTDCVIYDGWIPENGVMMKALPVEFDARGWVEVDLPHDWVIEGNYVHDPTLQYDGYLSTGIGCYRKVFGIPSSDEGRLISIEFDGVFRNSQVWVNGHLLGTHPSGYTSFHYDITNKLRYGEEGGNTIFVRIDAREPEGWWYEGGGIYRHVWLVKSDRLHVAHWGTYVTTPEITEQLATVSIHTRVCNGYDETKRCELVSRIVDAEGKEVASVAAMETIRPRSEAEFHQTASIKEPRLWSVENPYLYKVLTEVKYNGMILDTYETPFGIRTIEFTSDKGFFLNGKRVPIKGTCNHQDFGGVGIALPDSLIEYKLQQLKAMGCNAYRSAHHPPTPELLDICDRIGILVMDENRWLSDSSERIADLKSMLYRDRNHPCIILWSMENEEAMQAVPNMGARILKKLVDITHDIDPTRPVTAAVVFGFNEWEYRSHLDVIGYNYAHWVKRNLDGREVAVDLYEHTTRPGIKSVGSETDRYPVTRGIYEADKSRGYYSIVGNPDCHQSVERSEQTWRDVINYPFLSGIFPWTGYDYRGESEGWPNIVCQFGALDTCGFPKDQFYYYQSIWKDEPMVHIFPHWNWPGKEGQEMEIWAYSNCDEVELFLNGESQGKQLMISCSHMTWKVKYAPGVLAAKAWKNGQLLATKVVETTNPPAKVHLDPHRAMIAADGCDVSVVRVSILDDKGRVVPTACNDVNFTLKGPGKILGVGNGDPSSHEPDRARYRRTFNGYCMALVQAEKEPGQITLRATSPGLLPAAAHIEVVDCTARPGQNGARCSTL